MDDIRSYDVPLINAVYDAWRDPGPYPEYHKEFQDRLRREWPTLAKALDRMQRIN